MEIWTARPPSRPAHIPTAPPTAAPANLMIFLTSLFPCPTVTDVFERAQCRAVWIPGDWRLPAQTGRVPIQRGQCILSTTSIYSEPELSETATGTALSGSGWRFVDVRRVDSMDFWEILPLMAGELHCE